MTPKWIAINLLLLAVTGALARQLYVSVLRFNAENNLARIQPVRDMKKKMVQESPPPKMAPTKSYSAAEFAIIPEKSVFSESRSKEEKVEVATPAEPPPMTQKPILVGVAIIGNKKTASIIDPTSSPQNPTRRAEIKYIGDVYRGYTITSIAPDRIVLESGTRKEIIPLHEGSKRARGGRTSILSTRVVPIGTGGAGGGIPVSIVSGGPSTTGATRTPSAPVSVPASVSVGQAAGGQGSAASARQASAAAQQQTQQQAQPAQQQAPSPSGTDSQRGRVIRTPFGDMVRPNKD